MFEIPKLKLRDHTGVYAPGKARIRQILETALDLLIGEGYAAVTLRELARRCQIRVGAVNYYYESRDGLMRDLLEGAVAPYNDVFASIANDRTLSAEERLERLIRINLEDMQTEKTTKLFPEVWATANRDPFVAGVMDDMYTQQRAHFGSLIAEINPALGDRQRELLTLYVSFSMEGATMFMGYGKPWADALPHIQNIAVTSILSLVKTITNEQIDQDIAPIVAKGAAPTPKRARRKPSGD